MKKDGFSLIELLVAMAVLITMLLSLETLYVNTVRVTQKNKLKNQAQSLARKTMEEYKSLDFEKLKAIDGDVTDGQTNQAPGTNFNQQISVDFVDRDWADEDNDGDQNELIRTDNETNIMKLRIVISDRKQPKRIDDTVLETLVSEGGHTNLPQFKITASPEITNAGNVAITIRSSEALDPNAASGNPLDVTILFADGTNSGNIYTSGGFTSTGTNQWAGTFTVYDSTVDGNSTITVRGRSMPGQPVGLWGIEKEGILIDTYSPTYRDLIPLTGSSFGNRRPLISAIFKDEGDTSYTPVPKPSLLDSGSLSITINGNPLSAEELANVSKITQAEDPSLSEYELKINYVPTIDLPDGNYIVNITISDLAGNATMASTNFTITGTTVPDNAQPMIYPTLPMNPITGQVSTDPALPAIIAGLKPTISAKIEDLPAGGASGIDPSSIVLTLDGNPVTHTYSIIQVSWTPSSDLSLDYVYEVKLNLKDNGVDFTDDSGGGPPDGDKYDTAADGTWEHPNSADEAKWYFKITTRPIVTAVYPPNGENLNSKITVGFDREMDVQSIKDSLSVIGTVDITSLVLAQTTVWSSLDKTITFNDNQADIFQNNETYTITINNTAKDINGVNLEIAYSWTISTPDTMPPVFWHHDHDPPQNGQIRNTFVTIRVRVQDNIALPQNKTYLYYQNKIGPDEWSSWYNIAMTFLSWNETNKDAEFSAVIDQSYVTIPEGLSDGMIQYYFKAEDAVTNGSCFDAASADSSWVSEPTSPYSFTIVSPNFIFFDDFEGDEKGWAHNGTKDDWQVDIPKGKGGGYYRGNPDPTSAHSGTKCYGNDLTGIGANQGDYENKAANYLTSPDINCTGKTNVHLTFYRWLNVDRNSNDKAYIVVNSGSKWDTAFSNSDTATITDSSWTLQTINISSWADGKKKVRIRFGLTSNGSVNYSGWNIDDVTIKEGE